MLPRLPVLYFKHATHASQRDLHERARSALETTVELGSRGFGWVEEIR
jgi:hypothetical protein